MDPSSLYYENSIPQDVCELTEEELNAFFDDAPPAPTSRSPAKRFDRAVVENVAEERVNGATTTKSSSSESTIKAAVASPSKGAQRAPVTPTKGPMNGAASSRVRGSPGMVTPSKAHFPGSAANTPSKTQTFASQQSPPKPSQYFGEGSVMGMRRVTIRQLQNAKRDYGSSLKGVYTLQDDYRFITATVVATVKKITPDKTGQSLYFDYLLSDCTGEMPARLFTKDPAFKDLPDMSKDTGYPAGLPLQYVRVVTKLNEHRSRKTMEPVSLRPANQKFEPYAHQFGCMFDTICHSKATKPENEESGSAVPSDSAVNSDPAVKLDSVVKLESAVQSGSQSFSIKAVEALSASSSSSGTSSYVSVNGLTSTSSGTESFDMVEEASPIGPEFGDEVSAISLAKRPYPPLDFSISTHLAATKDDNGKERAQPFTPNAQARSAPVTPVRATPDPRRTPQRTKDTIKFTPKAQAAAPRTPRTPVDASRRRSGRKSKSHVQESTPKTRGQYSELTTDQRNIILCIQTTFNNTPRGQEWVGVWAGDIGPYVVAKEVMGTRSMMLNGAGIAAPTGARWEEISKDLDTLLELGYIETTIDESHFDCVDHLVGQSYTNMLADLTFD
ncbi:hypothetical protein BD626DRAFT_481991 [Schizophyllum amplum]|uniref:Uncharacterized protein n=1 Tax=Schizophyllum amplum TaxID=97359 RepID=A0A550CUR5_9AGAR|nr:hypothetical protein BD626DRAFT_481991 [Auriculariopsis ampla]